MTPPTPIRRILVHLPDGAGAREPLRLAVALAEEHGAEVAAIHAVEPLTAAYLTPEVSAVAVQLSAQAEQASRDVVEALVRELAPGVALEPRPTSPLADPVDVVLRQARVSDLLVVGQPDPEHADGRRSGFAARVLVGAGCPVLLVPRVDWTASLADGRRTCGSKVLIAWSDTRESARALRDALPLLGRAERVELVRFVHVHDGEVPVDDASLELPAAHLRRHGIEPVCTLRPTREPSLGERLRRGWVPDASIGESLLSHAADVDADLIVMGGYGHPRAWELALGGVTRTLLHAMTVPILMSH